MGPDVFVKVNPGWWPRNPGSVLVIPVEHHENLYELPLRLATPMLRAVQSAASAMRTAYGCDGISTRRHNEPAGNQDVWHHHVHVIPRWEGDDLYRSARARADAVVLRRRADVRHEVWPTD
ncbi:HIT family protein [Iamia majanohamensis]|uniref:HIT family protein n=1 Tax=Iamia majanohamensis TaxID=467976 RepID=A0AAF0BTU1_9ACTN|nr:HIT family protein [Iamia majanohamensis]WCO65198.1 HIT family protein [Iamia majanohamensis]